MNLTLFIFFVLPLSTILLSIVLQRILKSPILVAITFFAIYLLLAFLFFSDTLAEALIAIIIYTIIAYITAFIVMTISRCERRVRINELNNIDSNEVSVTENSLKDEDSNNNNNMPCENVGRIRNNMQSRLYRRF